MVTHFTNSKNVSRDLMFSVCVCVRVYMTENIGGFLFFFFPTAESRW